MKCFSQVFSQGSPSKPVSDLAWKEQSQERELPGKLTSRRASLGSRYLAKMKFRSVCYVLPWGNLWSFQGRAVEEEVLERTAQDGVRGQDLCCQEDVAQPVCPFHSDCMAVFLQWEQAASSDRARVVTRFSSQALWRDCNLCPQTAGGRPL